MLRPEYCQVALPRPVHQTFVYRVPPELREAVEEGVRVLVPFGRRRMVGLVTGFQEETELSRVRSVEDVLDDRPVLREEELELCRWVASYYVAPPGPVLRAALPPGFFSESGVRVRLTESGQAAAEAGGDRDAAAEARVLERLARAADGLLVATLRDELDLSAAWRRIGELRDRGLVEVREESPEADASAPTRQVVRLTRQLETLAERDEVFGRAHRQREAYEALEELEGEATVSHMDRRLGFSRSVIRGLADREVAEIVREERPRDPYAGLEEEAPEPRHEPTPAQAEVIRDLLEALDEPRPGVSLLRGVTGSGKTLVYLELLEEVVNRRGQGAIVLVPEISLTPQTVRRFRARFGDGVAVLHSRLSAGERRDEWRALREGRKRVAVGARSAVFAPVGELGAVVVDEEHESSYKQSDVPRYHARAVAAVRCQRAGALCVLGSATPSLESWARARDGGYRLHELPDRVTPHPLPTVDLVDLRAVGAGGSGDGSREGAPDDPRSEGGGAPLFSDELRGALEEVFRRDEQAILLLNRRGFSNFLQCRSCGRVWRCNRCSISLTHHRTPPRLVCHHCGFETSVPARCDECGDERLRRAGVGTERLERRLGELYPEVRIARMDVDTTGTRWAHEQILDRVRRREVDVLLGTQMIAKGLDLPDVTLVGVVNADVGLNLPDFRATERTFQLLAQVAGRAGRGERPGRVLVQTSRPDHFALRAAVDHDYPGFAERELEDRRVPGYPPHRRMANLVVSGTDPDRVAREAADLAEWTEGLLEEEGIDQVELVGPAPCPIERLRGRWRWHFFLRSPAVAPLGAVLRYTARKRAQPGGSLRLELDRDPEALL